MASIYMCDNCGNETSDSKMNEHLCFYCKKGIFKLFRNKEVTVFSTKKGKKKIEDSETNKNIEFITDKTYEQEEIRYLTGFQHLDNIYGNGIAKGSANLIYGAPGVGKSTLFLKILDFVVEKYGIKAVYITTEENKAQIKARYNRLGCKSKFAIDNENRLEVIISTYKDYDFIVLDSAQSIYAEDSGQIGGIAQSKNTAFNLQQMAKEEGKTLLIVSQVTKDDEAAGSRALTHLVDSVLRFDYYDDNMIYRYAKFDKNRNGDINNIAIFEMKENGLEEILEPSLLFVDTQEEKIGSTISLIMEGQRPIFIEVQSLVEKKSDKAEKSYLQSIGYDLKKLMQISAILSYYTKEKMYDYNIFLNIAGGLKITKPSIDLAVLVAIISSKHKKKIKKGSLFLGEVSLSGEIRKIPFEKEIVNLAKNKFGFKHIYCNSEGYKTIADVLLDI